MKGSGKMLSCSKEPYMMTLMTDLVWEAIDAYFETIISAISKSKTLYLNKEPFHFTASNEIDMT
jgi:hypothetical protein